MTVPQDATRNASSAAKEKDYQAQLRKLSCALADPWRLRIVVCGVALAIAYFGIYGPLNGQIELASRKLNDAEKRQAVGRDVEFLQAQMAMIQPRLGPPTDANECVQYLLDGIRNLPVKLIRLDPDSTFTMGPYEVVVLRVETRGDVRALDALLSWLETNERLLRIDSIKLTPPKDQKSHPSLCFTLLGLKAR
jgi:hypothetical protein